ncbi:MAG: phosphatidylserine/phosphatidylglycerophosphate/cardiolipin synthase family protein [Sphaerochaetaceae bacterium]|nr:phosphatidylserine/phosphatidylglycerophosphate/cardiolipin synthase family protein [Sphaerochaetaceae bacterium]
MRKFLSILFFSLFLILAVSCGSTKAMVTDPVVTDTEVDLGEKLDIMSFSSVELRDVEIFHDGELWLDELVSYVNKAENYILLCSFLVSECEENEILYEALTRRAQEGVEVYFMYDSSSLIDMTESKYHLRSIDWMREKGVHLYRYNSYAIDRAAGLNKYFLREHRKLVVIDGHTVMVGGMNLNYNSTTSSQTTGQRDAMYVFESPDCAQVLTSIFVETWDTYSWEEIGELKTSEIPDYPDNGWLHAWVINQGGSDSTMSLLFGSMFYSAEKEILCLPLLPLLNGDMKKAIKDTTDRGVEFTLIFPLDERTGNRIAAKYGVMDLLDCGVNVYGEITTDKTDNLLHEKLMIVDRRYSMIGSANLNFRSLALSNEMAIIIDSPEFAEVLCNHFESLMKDTEPIFEEKAQEWRNFTGFINFILCTIMG